MKKVTLYDRIIVPLTFLGGIALVGWADWRILIGATLIGFSYSYCDVLKKKGLEK